MIAVPLHFPISASDLSNPPAIVRRFREEDALVTAASTESLYTFMSPFEGPSHFWLDQEAYSNPSEEKFEQLATTSPATLVKLLQVDKLSPADLTFAAEIAGRVLDADRVIRPLLGLLRHTSALVREGAIYGLSHHLMAPSVRERLQQVAETDSSSGVREAAREILDA